MSFTYSAHLVVNMLRLCIWIYVFLYYTSESIHHMRYFGHLHQSVVSAVSVLYINNNATHQSKWKVYHAGRARPILAWFHYKPQWLVEMTLRCAALCSNSITVRSSKHSPPFKTVRVMTIFCHASVHLHSIWECPIIAKHVISGNLFRVSTNALGLPSSRTSQKV